jgi:acyl-CoA-binding protein|tara:strand:+ start:291 stop:470 length:180 start_codon:yes stop_codon:yes gene_type:complete
MYGLFKQATVGNAPETNPRKGMAEKYKYNAWCAQKGKTPAYAKVDYIITWSVIETKFSL